MLPSGVCLLACMRCSLRNVREQDYTRESISPEAHPNFLQPTKAWTISSQASLSWDPQKLLTGWRSLPG